jgi:hypothetical protein
MMGGLSTASEGAFAERTVWSLNHSTPAPSRRLEEPLDFQLQVALSSEDLGPRNSLRELRRTIVRVEEVLDVADVTLTLLEPRGWQLVAIRFDDELAVIIGRHARPAEVVSDLALLPTQIRRTIGENVRLCATVDDQILEFELSSEGLRPVDTDRHQAGY